MLSKSEDDDNVGIIIAYASQTGSALGIAQQSALQLQQAGKTVRLVSLNQLTREQLLIATHLLIVASTYGDGEAPDNGNRFISRAFNTLHAQSLKSVKYLILGLGDSTYNHFCGFGQKLHNALHQYGARAIADMIYVDNLDESALRHWQYYLGKTAGSSHFADWSKPTYGDWTLTSRTCINPNSLGAPVYHLTLQPLASSTDALSWQAGDIAEIGPRNCSARIEYFLQRINRTLPIESLLDKNLDLSEQEVSCLLDLDDDALIASLKELAHREYSIASVPEENSLHLLVRQVQLSQEQSANHDTLHRYSSRSLLGIGSGWLTAHAPLSSPIRLRIRSNPRFHSPSIQHPMILIGNGTGIAGLRSHVANPARAMGKHWLFFGERSESADDFFSADINRWQQTGLLTRVNKVFSRDTVPAAPRYVQDLLMPNATDIREWVAAGAAIFVCGSLQGMAQSVDDVLGVILGVEQLEYLADQQRYCRDVY